MKMALLALALGTAPTGQDHRPQQQGSFVRAPYRGQPIVQRQRRIRILCDIGNAEIIGREGIRQRDRPNCGRSCDYRVAG